MTAEAAVDAPAGRGRRRAFLLLTGVVVVIAGAAAAAGARWFPVILLALAAESFLACWVLRPGRTQNLALAVAVILVALAGSDLVIRRLTPNLLVTKIYSGRDAVAGFNIPRPHPTAYSVHARQTANGDPVYGVTYTLDTNGHRVTPGGGPGADTYLFFGDSFTYGEGLEDSETLPTQFSKATDLRYTVVNLAFHGLGPHNMLRLIESGDVDHVVTGKVRRAYFSTIPDHLSRVLARRDYMLFDPRYVLGDDGRPVYTGRFIDHISGRLAYWAETTGGLPARTRALLLSLLCPDSCRLHLMLAILHRSAELLADKYGAELIILVWDTRDDGRDLGTAIREAGLNTITVSSLIGDAAAPEYHIMPGIENHPSAVANQKLAAALVARERGPTSGGAE